MEPIFLFPPKRDVAGMSVQLATIEPEQRISVGIETERYGVTLVEGPAWITDADELVVGGVHIAKKATVKKEVEVRAPEREVKRVLSDTAEVARGSQADAVHIGHGDFVSVDFSQDPHGDFTITGVATAGEGSDFVTVGPWVIHNRIERDKRVTSARVIAAFGEHDMPVPAKRSANYSAVDGAVDGVAD